MERNGENLKIDFHGNKLELALDEIKYFEGRAMRIFVTMMDEHQISFDGNHKRLLHPGEKLVVHRAKETTKMIHLRDVSFLDRIRTKLQADDD